MLERQLAIRVCEHFQKEVSQVLKSSHFPKIKCIGYPARCGRPPIEFEELQLDEPTYQIILGSCCLSRLNECQDVTNCEVVHLDNCFQLIVSNAVTEYLIAQQSYITSPGWLVRWREQVQSWGDKATACCMFREAISNIIMLDTGTYQEIENDLHILRITWIFHPM